MPQVSVVDLREELRWGEPLGSEQIPAGENERTVGEKRTDHAVFEPQRLCRLCILPFLWICGENVPHCDVSLSEHNNGRLLCHYCGYETRKPQVCPQCGSPYIGGFKAGTQQIEKVVRIPSGVRTLRMEF